MKPEMQYYIYKMFRGAPTMWDGPYQTLKVARSAYAAGYANPRGEAQDFYIYKHVTTITRVR